LKAIQSKYWTWISLSVCIGGMIFIPLLFVLEGFTLSGSTSAEIAEKQGNINHLKEYVLPEMIYTTLRMIFGVSFVSLLLGVMPAYLLSNYRFPLSNFLRKFNILPLTIPTYIMGFVYASIFSVTGTFTKIALFFFTREQIFSWDINVITEGWLMVFLGFSLYPYVYSSCLLHFSEKNKSLAEAASTLGVSPVKRFLSVSLPLAVPSILGGVSLVVMEVINDYGAMSYFNVKTFTAGIFQAKQMNFSGSLYLSALLFLVVTFVFSTLFFIRSIRRVKQSNSGLTQLKFVSRKNGIFFSLICFLPFFLGFIVPVFQLVYLASNNFSALWSSSILIIFFNALQIALIAGILIVFFAVVMHYNRYLNRSKFANFLANVSTLGYAIPGAVIGVAVIAFIYTLDSSGSWYQWTINSLVLLIFAYVIRFFAVGYNTTESVFNQVSSQLPDASRTLGKGALSTFFKVYFPSVRFGLLTTLAVVTIDVLKELPLTLILQPFNFETLATKAYKKAKVAESVADAAPYALLLILSGILVTLIFMRSDKKI
jgi:iron(III) transport system permease protein